MFPEENSIKILFAVSSYEALYCFSYVNYIKNFLQTVDFLQNVGYNIVMQVRGAAL